MSELRRYQISPDGSSVALPDDSFAGTMSSFWEGFMGEDPQPLASASVMDTPADKASMLGNLFSAGPAAVKRFGQYLGTVPSEFKEIYSELDEIPELGPFADRDRKTVDSLLSMGVAGVAGLAGTGGLGPNILNVSRKEALGMLATGARNVRQQGIYGKTDVAKTYPDIIKGLLNIPERELADLDEIRLLSRIEDSSTPETVMGRFTDKSQGEKNLIELAVDPLARGTVRKEDRLASFAYDEPALTTLPHEVVHLRHKNPPAGSSAIEKGRATKIVNESIGVPYAARPQEIHPRHFEEEFGRRVRALGKGERLDPLEYERVYQDTLDATYARTEIGAVGEAEVPFIWEAMEESGKGILDFSQDLAMQRTNLMGKNTKAGEYLRDLRRMERHARNRLEGTGGISKADIDKDVTASALRYHASGEDLEQLIRWLDDTDGPRGGTESRGPIDLTQAMRVPGPDSKLIRPNYRLPKPFTNPTTGGKETHGMVYQTSTGKFETYAPGAKKGGKFLHYSGRLGPRGPRSAGKTADKALKLIK